MGILTTINSRNLMTHNLYLLLSCSTGHWLRFHFFSLDRCSIPSREVSILWSYLDITLLFSSYVYLIFFEVTGMMLEELIINYNSKREDLEEEDQRQDERN